jgi:catechol 2,3-dioxygenase-like lactoylglutathione lyase family enzyme
MSVRRFSGVCIVTRDVRRMRDFYQAVLEAKVDGDDEPVTFRIEGAELSLFPAQGMEEMAPGSTEGMGSGSCVLEFEVRDVDRAYRRLVEMQVPIVKLPQTYPWGRRSLWFHDPDGNVVNFYAQVGRA